LKSDHRLSRNLLKGVFGDSINPLLAAAAFNLLKYTRVEYDHLNKPTDSLAKRRRFRKNKYRGLPLWRIENPLF
ncbi:MAG: hypothetical protein LBR53_00320, partial [Deltaproteobacteria bacterium]|nr:hypothetical protein [Deltaproteobacteria bacterium]